MPVDEWDGARHGFPHPRDAVASGLSQTALGTSRRFPKYRAKLESSVTDDSESLPEGAAHGEDVENTASLGSKAKVAMGCQVGVRTVADAGGGAWIEVDD